MTHRFRLFVFGAALAFALSGCGGKATIESPPAPTAKVDPATAGSIAGTVTFEGVLPSPKPIDMSASPACVQANPRPVYPQTIAMGDDGTVGGVVVYVKDAPANYRYDAPSGTVVLQQKNCMYQPYVIALTTNQPFEIRNNDPTMHNVHPMPKRNRQWSKSQPAGSAALKETFTRPEFAMPVLCNVHPWMRALVFVFDHPYYAVTPRDGNFELKNLPPGAYTIEAWHETLGTQDQTVTIAPRESKRIVFTFKPAAPAAN